MGEVGSRTVAASIAGGEGAVQGVAVTFHIVEGPGTLLLSGAAERVVETDAWGIAEVNWYPVQHLRRAPEAAEAQIAVIHASCDDPRALRLSLNQAQSGWATSS